MHHSRFAPASHSARLLLAAFVAILCATAPQARAQFATNLALPKTDFLALEPMQVTITIMNRSGADVVMSGNEQSNWLTFEITDSTGRSIAPVGLKTAKPFIFKAGTTISEKFVVTDYYGIDQLGSYGITANVYHPPTKQYYTSNRVHFNVMDTKPWWEAPIGVPAGYPDAGRVRRYALIIFRDLDRASLYFRLIDDRLNQTLGTSLLGPVTIALEPEASIDRNNLLHTFFVAQPRVYCHVIIGPDGKLKKREYFKETEGNRPAMIAGADGSIGVRGGEAFDPAAPAPPKGQGRSVSERPPGL